MKKVILLVVINCFFYLNVSAGNEEDACFVLLNQAVGQDLRFKNPDILPDGDLTKVLFDESNSSYYDFSTYDNFSDKRVVNPVRKDWGGNREIFPARRNNIGTIISGNNYVLSQISGFGRDSNFDFPLESKSGLPFGDKYKLKDNFFKEYVIFTHHIRKNTNSGPYNLMSCGIAKVVPLGGRTFSEINESGYMTNILNGIAPQVNLGGSKCASGFEGEYDSEDGEDFYKMKANVCVQSYDESDYLKLEVISIAYDNDSKRLNEYYTHPLQVEAMRNNANHAQGLKGIQDIFRSKLENETCFSIIHGDKVNLPASCNNNYGPIAYNSPKFSLRDYLIPNTFADLEIEDPSLESTQNDTGMMVYGNLPYTLYKKLESIPDESFREYMLLSVLPNFEELIEHRQKNNILLTPFEEIFLSCNINYPERLEIVTDFLNDLNLEDFSLSTLNYSNESYGDCIIPYPDVDKINSFVEVSFESNKLLAEKLNGTYAPSPDAPEVEEYIKKREALLAELNTLIQDIDKRFNAGDIDVNRARVLKIEEQEKIKLQIDALDFASGGISDSEKEIVEDTLQKPVENSNNILIYVIIGLLVTLGVGSIVFSFYKKNKIK